MHSLLHSQSQFLIPPPPYWYSDGGVRELRSYKPKTHHFFPQADLRATASFTCVRHCVRSEGIIISYNWSFCGGGADGVFYAWNHFQQITFSAVVDALTTTIRTSSELIFFFCQRCRFNWFNYTRWEWGMIMSSVVTNKLLETVLKSLKRKHNREFILI